MARDIYVITHAQSEHHVQGVVGGWHDTELTALGRRQADAIAARIADLVGDAPVEIYASDLKRAVQTAEPIAMRLGIDLKLMSGMREKSFGVAGGRPTAWLDARFVSPPKDGDRLDHHEGIEGAETRRALFTRLFLAMEQILASLCETQVIVTHGFALTGVIAAWFRVPIEAAGWIGFRPASGGITHLQQDDRFFDRALVSFNDRGHLQGL
ncbi:MAG TPA: histidine phosphatase family protein [Caulobacteraceae bacterium]|jgi:probable phosphoglycerate mutase